MNRDGTVAAPQVLVPGVVSLAASSSTTRMRCVSCASAAQLCSIGVACAGGASRMTSRAELRARSYTRR